MVELAVHYNTVSVYSCQFHGWNPVGARHSSNVLVHIPQEGGIGCSLILRDKSSDPDSQSGLRYTSSELTA